MHSLLPIEQELASRHWVLSSYELPLIGGLSPSAADSRIFLAALRWTCSQKGQNRYGGIFQVENATHTKACPSICRPPKYCSALYLIGPIARLAVEVEDEPRRTTDGGEAVAPLEVVLDAAHGIPEASVCCDIRLELVQNFLTFSKHSRKVPK